MLDLIESVVESVRSWTAFGGDWRTWAGHSLACTAPTAAGFVIALALSVVVHPVLAFLALPGAWAAPNAFYAVREFGREGDFRGYVSSWNLRGMADSALDFFVPFLVSGAALAGLVRLYWEVVL